MYVSLLFFRLKVIYLLKWDKNHLYKKKLKVKFLFLGKFNLPQTVIKNNSNKLNNKQKSKLKGNRLVSSVQSVTKNAYTTTKQKANIKKEIFKAFTY